ncbi:hypothetical protein NDI33_05535 [Trichocoleus sp. DQ-A1]
MHYLIKSAIASPSCIDVCVCFGGDERDRMTSLLLLTALLGFCISLQLE